MKAVFVTIALLLMLPTGASATQGHGGPEGLYAHQMAHLFFLFAMGLLIYWLRRRRLVDQAGWRLIQYAALFFILWNLDAFVVHLLEEQMGLLEISRPGRWQISITAPLQWHGVGWVYYLAKLDHLFCVPAIIFLYMGLRRLTREAPHQPTRGAAP
jgi:hypothetical protein